jgi:hypothetical protein
MSFWQEEISACEQAFSETNPLGDPFNPIVHLGKNGW